jgi:hypothetical protein
MQAEERADAAAAALRQERQKNVELERLIGSSQASRGGSAGN